MSVCDPVGIFLASSGSRGDRLLFRFPYETEEDQLPKCKGPVKNPYAVRIAEDLHYKRKQSEESSIKNGVLVRYSDKVLANLLAVKASLCGQKFEVKINDVLFIGHPLLLHPVSCTQPSPKRELPTMISFNVVFALQATADKYLISYYHDFAKQLSIGLRHEERRCGYLSQQQSLFSGVLDEVATMPEDMIISPYTLMVKRSPLAKQLKIVYEDLCSTGVVQLYLNKWVHVNFCLPHKVHNQGMSDCSMIVKPERIQKCLDALRPYHGMLLMVDENSFIESLPIDSSPSLARIIRVASPLKNMQNLASDADISLGHVYQVVSHLIYWGKATIIYPLCETNVYVVAPSTNTYVNSSLVTQFVESFPGVSLPVVLSEFSMPSPLGDHRDILGMPQQQAQEVQMVVWMLRHRFLLQLHTYVFLMPSSGIPPHHTSSLLSPTLENLTTSLRKTSSGSDMASVGSDDSFPPCKSQTMESLGAQPEMSEEVRTVWQHYESNFSSLSPAEKNNILKVPAASNPEDLKLLARLGPYFNGKHHLEEIMFYENIRRSQLLTILDKFRAVLITCQHEDPVITCWEYE